MTSRQLILLLPVAAREVSAQAKRWLSRGRVLCDDMTQEWLPRVCRVLRVDSAKLSLAAFRYLGQTGTPPPGWIAAADPVHFETRLRELRVREPGTPVGNDDLAALFADLQTALGTDALRFEAVEGYGYLHATSPLPTADCGVSCAAGRLPDHLMPEGEGSARFHGLQSEVQMFLHDHALNESRRGGGLAALSSLWLWGGGRLADSGAVLLPPLCSPDPLLKGYWRHADGQEDDSCDWPPKGCGGVYDGRDASDADELLDCFRQNVRQGVDGTVLFADGLSVTLTRRDLWRFLRPVDPRLDESPEHD